LPPVGPRRSGNVSKYPQSISSTSDLILLQQFESDFSLGKARTFGSVCRGHYKGGETMDGFPIWLKLMVYLIVGGSIIYVVIGMMGLLG
jgi:hypothetical protein